MRKKIGVIGHLAQNQPLCDGQTVKTREFISLMEQSGEYTCVRVDTWLNKCHKQLKLFCDTLLCLFSCQDIFLMVAENGMRFYLPFLYWFSRLKKIRVYHYIVGSEILDIVKNDRKLVKYLNSFVVNWFEYQKGTDYLLEMGVSNAVTLRNFKRLTPVEKPKKYEKTNGFYRYCTFSRVLPEKGIADAVQCIRAINAAHGKTVAELDIYGPVEQGYLEAFQQLVKENEAFVTYKGIAEPHQSVEILKEYYALLFPTRWPGEGVPGTVIDAFAAGLPILATDWHANGEIICHGTNGILYPRDELKTLQDAVTWSMQHEQEMDEMRLACREEFAKYLPETVFNTVHAALSKRAV